MSIGEFALRALAPSIVNGVATGAFYAFIAIPLVLSFQVSRSVALTLVLHRTKFGLYVRAIADDVGAAQIVGLPVERLAVAVWAISGAIAGLAGVCIVVFFRVTDLVVLTVFLQAIVVGILGGFNSLPLILLGSLVLGEVESIVGGGTFGTVSGANRELILM